MTFEKTPVKKADLVALAGNASAAGLIVVLSKEKKTYLCPASEPKVSYSLILHNRHGVSYFVGSDTKPSAFVSKSKRDIATALDKFTKEAGVQNYKDMKDLTAQIEKLGLSINVTSQAAETGDDRLYTILITKRNTVIRESGSLYTLYSLIKELEIVIMEEQTNG